MPEFHPILTTDYFEYGTSTNRLPLNEQTTWSAGYHTAYGKWTSTLGALATWGVIAGLPA